MKQVRFWQHAPEGSLYSPTAFDSQIGREVQLTVDDGRVVTVKITKAEVNPNDGGKSVLLTFEAGDDIAGYFSDSDAVYFVDANIES